MIRLAVRVRREDAELVLAELLELAPSGVEEVDEGDVVEYAVYGAPGELPALPGLRAAAGEALVDVVTSEVADDWAQRWREFHRPVEAGGLRVRAPWHEPRDGDVVIDPGQAFGTGAHPTTRLCLELLAALGPPAGDRGVVDAGCGSGVLAIAAARMGFSPVLGLDFDPLAVEATIDNARVNGVEVDARRWDLRDEPVPAASLVLANILRPSLLAMAFAAVPAVVIASGLLDREADEVAADYARRFGLRERRRAVGDGWCALDLRNAGVPDLGPA